MRRLFLLILVSCAAAPPAPPQEPPPPLALAPAPVVEVTPLERHLPVVAKTLRRPAPVPTKKLHPVASR